MPRHDREPRGHRPRHGRSAAPTQLEFVWRTGPRTRAWNDLWQRLLAEPAPPMDDDSVEPGTAAPAGDP